MHRIYYLPAAFTLLVRVPIFATGGAVPVKDSISQGITTVGSESLLQFAMTPTEFGDDVYLYEQLIEPTLDSGMLRPPHPG